ncbi:MAG: EAL domain-containing protein [Epulopiscium sp.]|nr:EAL domain-containing protein [Candidatus Epulonipiscium sp.]
MGGILGLGTEETLELLRVAVEQAQDWIVVTNARGEILYVNDQVENISGYSKNEIIGQKPSIWKSNKMPESTYEELWNEILSGRHYYGVIVNKHKDGGDFYLANTISPVEDSSGRIKYFIATAKDITRSYELKREIDNITYYDSLTQLPNRASFIELIQETVCGQRKSAILVIGMKNLSLVNNTYGFKYGDKIIKSISKNIRKVLKKEYILGRIENHTFAVFIPEFKSLSEIAVLINTIEKTVGSHIRIENEEIYIKLSIGIGVAPSDATNGMDLLARAQIAQSKVEEVNNSHTYAFYTSRMDQEAQEQLYMENEIFKAYENDEFIPYFQPFIDLKSGKICGLEALMRRRNSRGDIILPCEFIGVLEQMGLIERMELIFIEKVCYQIKEWLEAGYNIVPVAINISPLQFANQSLVNKIMEIVNKVGIPSNLLTIEITESQFMKDVELTKSILNELKEEGFIISIDDFGTGYSSFSYLKEFYANQLKIDISFIENITSNQDDRAIVKAIVTVAKILEMKTIAEGIETIEQFDIIKDIGCDIGQGHYWGEALPADEIASRYLQL